MIIVGVCAKMVISDTQATRQETIEKIVSIIKGIENPYPKDIFVWDNQEKLDFNRGRFNKFIFEVVENIREKIIKEVLNGINR
jgi:hypothetical protein